MFGLNPYLWSSYYGGGSSASSPYGQPKNTGEGTSFSWDADEQRKARGAALMQLGIGLLSGAGTGKLSEGLASGLQGFSQTMMDARERERARQRQQQMDAMAREEHSSSMESARLNRTVVQTQQENIEEDRQREDAKRQRRAASVPMWIRDIEAELGADSPEAKKARNYAALGEDIDLERLERLYDSAVDQSPEGQARRQRRYQEETELQLGRVQEQGKAGFGPLVDTAQNRERISQGWAGIALQRQQEERMREWGPGYGMAGGIKPGAYVDDVLPEVERRMNDWLQTQPKPGDRFSGAKVITPKRGQPPPPGLDAKDLENWYAGRPVIVKAGPPTPESIEAKRREITRQVQEEIGGLYGSAPGGARPTMAPGEYVYKDGHMYRKTPQGLELVY